jgi:hypothetical protein
MGKFLFKSFSFIFLAIGICIDIFFFFKLDGYTDQLYLRFTTPKQTSLILGTSRAAQGIEPSVINNVLQRSDIYNYSFTIVHSPYGPTYYKSIKSKLREGTKDGVFIITVDPWSISGPRRDPNDSTNFPESKLALGKTTQVNMNPNVFYLAQSYDKSFYELFSEDTTSGIFLHNDGWLEITINMDSRSVSERLAAKVEDYSQNMLRNYNYSTLRMGYLIKTIEFLKNHGQVFLVRLPVSPQMLSIEDKLMPDFDFKIDSISLKMNIPYKNFKSSAKEFQYVDGNHLYKASGRNVSEQIGTWILDLKRNQEMVTKNK